MRRLIKTIFTIEGWHGLITSPLVAPWLWPTLAAAMVGLSSVFEAVPLPYVITAMAVTFGMFAHGVARVADWRARVAVSGKLGYSTHLVDCDVTHQENGATLDRIQLGVRWASAAEFPIQFKVVEFRVKFADRVSASEPDLSRTYDIPPHGHGWFRGPVIEINQPLIDVKPLGEIRYKIKYWKKDGSRSYFDERILRITMNPDETNGRLAFFASQA